LARTGWFTEITVDNKKSNVSIVIFPNHPIEFTRNCAGQEWYDCPQW